MKRILLALLVLALTAGFVYAGNYEVKKKVNDHDVTVTIDRNPPVVGDNNVTVDIRDAAGKASTDAKVKVYYSMPPMPGMPPMNYKTDAELKGSTYRAVMNLSMAGPWDIRVKITRGGKTSSVKLSVDAH